MRCSNAPSVARDSEEWKQRVKQAMSYQSLRRCGTSTMQHDNSREYVGIFVVRYIADASSARYSTSNRSSAVPTAVNIEN
jgi:hypothetical protein